MSKSLVPDIKPIPVKDRSTLGKVSLILDEGTEVTAVGVVYGIEHRISGDGFSATLFLDQFNQRIRVTEYTGPNLDALVMKLRWLSEANGFDKIICMATRKDWQQFLRHGYVLEAVLKYYLKGEDAYIVSKFRSQERLTSGNLMEEILAIEQIIETEDPQHVSDPSPDYGFRLARASDIPELIHLYQSIFESYPSPLVHEDYLRTVFAKETLFAVATLNGKIVAAASAELYPQHLSAELTDCATHPSSRGKGLMSYLLEILENEVLKRGYRCVYTMARARSYGMNCVFYRLGYEFMGRLINNCDIYGAYEDMNIWVRDMSVAPPRTVEYGK